MDELLECAVCGDTSLDVKLGLVCWREPRPHYETAYRCRDRQACRARVEAAGKRWPLLSGGTNPTVRR